MTVLNMPSRPPRKAYEFELSVFDSFGSGPSTVREVPNHAHKYLVPGINSSRERLRTHHLRKPKHAQSLLKLDLCFKSNRTRKYPGSKRDPTEIRVVVFKLGEQAKARLDAMAARAKRAAHTSKYLGAPKGTLQDLLLDRICEILQRFFRTPCTEVRAMCITALIISDVIQQIDGKFFDGKLTKRRVECGAGEVEDESEVEAREQEEDEVLARC